MRESLLWLVVDARSARRHGSVALAQRQRVRLAEMEAYARANSPYYGGLYRNLPERSEDPALLPVTEKKRLMARFDDWVTERDVRIGSVRNFIEDPGLIGKRFLGKYTVATTSRTTGTPGTFLLDDRTLSVTNALALRMLGAWFSCGDVIRIIVGGGRTVMVIATGGHFACGRRCTPSLRACFPRTSLPTLQLSAPRNCQSSPQVAGTAPSFH